jgi:hypothetical protein
MSSRWPSRQTGSWSRRHPATRQYGCGRRRQGRVAARWRAIPWMSGRWPSRQMGRSSTLMQAISLCLYPQSYHRLLGNSGSPPTSYCRASGCCATSNPFYGYRLNIDQAAQQYTRTWFASVFRLVVWSCYELINSSFICIFYNLISLEGRGCR